MHLSQVATPLCVFQDIIAPFIILSSRAKDDKSNSAIWGGQAGRRAGGQAGDRAAAKAARVRSGKTATAGGVIERHSGRRDGNLGLGDFVREEIDMLTTVTADNCGG